MSFDNNDDEEDNQNEIDYEKLENARYMKMARSRSRKQSKLFSQRKKVNLPKIKNSKQLFNEIYRNKRLHGPIYILTETTTLEYTDTRKVCVEDTRPSQHTTESIYYTPWSYSCNCLDHHSKVPKFRTTKNKAT